MIDLKGKTALLTASGQGIGKATAKAYSEAGAYVIATDINHETLSSLDKIVDETHILDVTDNNAIKKLVGAIKEPDILFRDNSNEEVNFSEWNLGDGTIINNELSFWHTYADTGTYTIKYYITNIYPFRLCF